MTNTTQATDLPLTDPRNPLHRAPVQEQLAAAVATEVKSDKPAPQSKKAKRQAKAEARKAKSGEQAAAKLVALLPAQSAQSAPVAETAPIVPDVERVKVPRSVVPGKYKTAYAAHDNTCGDEIGIVLKEHTFRQDGEGRDSIDLALLRQVADDNGLDWKWAHLNNGMQRMNLSNKLRGMHRHGKDVRIGEKTIKGAVVVKEFAKDAAKAA